MRGGRIQAGMQRDYIIKRYRAAHLKLPVCKATLCVSRPTKTLSCPCGNPMRP
jgi:hypothetical protein